MPIHFCLSWYSVHDFSLYEFYISVYTVKLLVNTSIKVNQSRFIGIIWAASCKKVPTVLTPFHTILVWYQLFGGFFFILFYFFKSVLYHKDSPSTLSFSWYDNNSGHQGSFCVTQPIDVMQQVIKYSMNYWDIMLTPHFNQILLCLVATLSENNKTSKTLLTHTPSEIQHHNNTHKCYQKHYLFRQCRGNNFPEQWLA